jgi:hypothetical protein
MKSTSTEDSRTIIELIDFDGNYAYTIQSCSISSVLRLIGETK